MVTDDRGRYVVPDLPKATYNVWVRGYGLVDSPKVQAGPGKILNLTAVAAPNARAAAEYYPPSYWYSLAKVPDKSEFPGTGPKGNGISEGMKSQADWLNQMRCGACHQIGTKATREIPKSLGTFHSSVAAWERRVKSGQMGPGMAATLAGFGPRGMAMYADWTDRIAAGEVPEAPPRPQGVERNVVVSLWDWSNDRGFVHDTISTDKRNPTLNANGPVYSISRFSAPDVNILDPVRHTATGVRCRFATRTRSTPTRRRRWQPSPYWGEEIIWSGQASLHNPMLDHTGRVWLTHAIRATANPACCKQGSSHPSAQQFPLNTSGRHLSVLRSENQAGHDDRHLLRHASPAVCRGRQSHAVVQWERPVLAWFNTKLFDETKDEQKAQGWTPFVIDTNGNGKRDAYVEPNQPIDPTKDKRIQGGSYGVIPSPVDGSIWLSVPGAIFLSGDIGAGPGDHSDRSGLEPAADRADGSLRAPVQQPEVARQRVYPAGDRHRSERRRLDRAGGQRTSGQLRPAQVQGALEWPDRDRTALSRRLDAARDARAEIQGRDRREQQRHALLQLGGSVRHARVGQERAVRHRLVL